MGSITTIEEHWESGITKFGAAHPIAADKTVIAARAATAEAKTVTRGLRIAMTCGADGEPMR